MLVKIISAPRGLDLNGIAQLSAVHLAKGIVSDDLEQPVLHIIHGNDEDIRKLFTKARITVERISEK